MNKLIFICAASLAMTACAKGQSADPIKGAEQASKARDLQATFDGVCEASPGWLAETSKASNLTGPKIIKTMDSYKFEGQNVTKTTSLYTDVGCNAKALQFKETGTYDAPYKINAINGNKGVEDLNDGSGAHYIQMKFSGLSLTPTSADGVTIANNLKLCDATGYATGTEKKSLQGNAALADCYGAKVETVYNSYANPDANKDLVLGSAVGSAQEKDAPTVGSGPSTFTFVRQK